MIGKIENIDPGKIKDPSLREVFVELLNLVEEQYDSIEKLKKENQSLQDEINRLKGEQGRPVIKSNNKATSSVSSEKERKRAKNWKKEGKKHKIPVDRRVICSVDKLLLPSDAVFKYIDKVISQDIRFERFNTEYLVEVYYSPSENKTYRAKLPSGYDGYFGSSLKGFILSMHHICDVTGGKLLTLLRTIGIDISTGSMSNIFLGYKELFIKEKEAILKAGLSGSYEQIDATGSKVKGSHYYTQIICGENFTVYGTMQGKSRMDVLSVLQGSPDEGILYTYNEKAKRLLAHFQVSTQDQLSLASILQQGEVLNQQALYERISLHIPELKAKKNMFKRVCESLAIAYYHEQKDYPPIEVLVSDDAPEYNMIATKAHGLCWVHDGRNYKKLTPRIEVHQNILKAFSNEYWKYYHRLLEYKSNPSVKLSNEREAEFEALFTRETDYFQLNQRIEKTYANKDKLLVVLENPQIPLHNNLSELAARRVVRKRDISLHTMSKAGTQVQDAFMSVVETAIKLGVNAYQYITDRVKGEYKMTPLADLVYINSP